MQFFHRNLTIFSFLPFFFFFFSYHIKEDRIIEQKTRFDQLRQQKVLREIVSRNGYRIIRKNNNLKKDSMEEKNGRRSEHFFKQV